MTDKTKYTATFVLTQDGLDGDVVSKLKFEPLLEEGGEAPLSFEIMAYLVQVFLHETGVIDEKGDLVDPESFHKNASLDISTIGRGKLN